jgi:hypothetical protein
MPSKDFAPTFRGRALSGEPSLDAAKVTTLGLLISDKQEGLFRLELAWIKAIGPAGGWTICCRGIGCCGPRLPGKGLWLQFVARFHLGGPAGRPASRHTCRRPPVASRRRSASLHA